MSENNIKHRGLCSTCKNASFCAFPRPPSGGLESGECPPDKPVFYCEEFEIEPASAGYIYLPKGSAPTRATRKERPQATESYVTEGKDSTKFIGLCSDCDNRQTCVFPKPEGGVWHCEEYQ